MAEVRIGHDQVTLRVSGPVRFEKGSIWFTASGYGDPGKVEKLTGSQPVVFVGDDGQIIAAWHTDLTDNFAEAREYPKSYINFQQEWKILSLQDI